MMQTRQPLFDTSDPLFKTSHLLLSIYYINITFIERVIVENIVPRNMIIKRVAAHICDYHPPWECITILLY